MFAAGTQFAVNSEPGTQLVVELVAGIPSVDIVVELTVTAVAVSAVVTGSAVVWAGQEQKNYFAERCPTMFC